MTSRRQKIAGAARFRLWTTRIVLFAGLAGVTACAEPVEKAPRWNVVLIVIDTLRADHLPIYGYDRPTTPFLSQFVKSGVVFENARSQAGCTFPSVNSLLTSKQPQRYMATMKEHGWGIPEHLPAVATMLSAEGYVTAAVSSSPVVRVNPSHHNPDGGYGPGFAEFDDSCMHQGAECVNEQAFRILDGFSEPYLLYLHYFDPHMPYAPPKTHTRVFAADEYEKDWVADGKLLPLNDMLYHDGPVVEFTDEDLAHAIDLYDEEILYLDGQLQQLVARLESDGTLERTLVVLAADHGEEFLEHDEIYHCRDLTYDTMLKTPLFMWIPGLDGPQTRQALVQNLDIVPTVLDYLAIDPTAYGLEGESLRPVIERDALVQRYSFALQRYSRSVTDGRFKLTYNIVTGDVELFDLIRDPTEQTNMVARRPDLAAGMETILRQWMDAFEGDTSVADRVEKATAVTERLRALGYL